MTTKTGIIYLQRDKFQLYSPYLASILEFRFVPELIRDFDLINRELLENLLKVFLGNNKVPPSGIVIVVSDSASFIKDFVSPPQPVAPNPAQPQTPPPTLEDLHNQANQYIEHVPFELVSSKVFPLATGVRAYATNQELYEGIKAVLEKQGFIIEAVLPGFVFGPNLSNRPTLDGTSIGIILQKVSTVQAYNLLKEIPPVAESSLPSETTGEKDTPSEENSSSETPSNKKVLIAVAISAIALIVIVTGIVVYLQFQQKPYVPPPPSAAQTSAPTPQISQSSAAIADAKDLTVQISAPLAAASTAATLRTTLMTYGFKSVVPQTQEGIAQSMVIFSPRVSQQVRTVVTDDVKKSIPTILIQNKPDATTDITIILGK